MAKTCAITNQCAERATVQCDWRCWADYRRSDGPESCDWPAFEGTRCISAQPRGISPEYCYLNNGLRIAQRMTTYQLRQTCPLSGPLLAVPAITQRRRKTSKVIRA